MFDLLRDAWSKTNKPFKEICCMMHVQGLESQKDYKIIHSVCVCVCVHCVFEMVFSETFVDEG